MRVSEGNFCGCLLFLEVESASPIPVPCRRLTQPQMQGDVFWESRMSQENRGAHIACQYGNISNYTSTTTSPYCTFNETPIGNYVLTV